MCGAWSGLRRALVRALFDPFRSAEFAWDIAGVTGASAQAIATRRASRLAALFDAARASPWYRRQIGDRPGSDIALESMPVQHKHELMRHFDQWVTDPALRLSQLQAFTADPDRIAEPYLDRYQVWESSGTSGTPAVFVQDARAMAVYDALEMLRRARPQGWVNPMAPSPRIAFVGATSGHFASYVSMLRLQRLNPWLAPSLQCFSIAQPVEALVAQLKQFSPDVIATYPTAAAMLASEAVHGHLRIALREVWTGGETLGRAMREQIGRQLGCAVRNSYGASEFLAMGWECASGNMHLNADWVILEPVDRHHQPVPPGKTAHTVLLTNLANHVQPLIRYDLGDQVRFVAEPCACGSGLPVIDVEGRHDDALVMAGRGKRTVTLLPLALSTVMEDEAGVFDFQLCQRDAHTLVLRLGLRGAQALAAADRCHAALRDFCTAQGVVRLRLVDELDEAPTHGRSGKVQRVIAMPGGPNGSGAA
jgi:phenylacetate-coenzyme A ligase PaaK-like adenylate-forming protein